MGFLLFRHRVLVALIVLLTFIAFGAYSSELDNLVWLTWVTGIVFTSLILLFDCVFFQDSAFIFDPDPENWRRQTDPRF